MFVDQNRKCKDLATFKLQYQKHNHGLWVDAWKATTMYVSPEKNVRGHKDWNEGALDMITKFYLSTSKSSYSYLTSRFSQAIYVYYWK